MAEEPKVTPETEEIVSTEAPATEAKVEVAKKEESTDSELKDFLPTEEAPTKPVETVPLSTFLALKDDLKDIKKAQKEASASQKASIQIDGINELSQKYPDVSKDFMNDIAKAISTKAEADALKKIEEKYSPIIAKQEQKDKLDIFNKKFDEVYDKALKDNPDLPKNIDKDIIKNLVLSPQYKNTKMADILVKVYGEQVSEKSSSENETRIATGDVETITNFDKITPDQKKAIMADDKARVKYFSWLDKNNK